MTVINFGRVAKFRWAAVAVVSTMLVTACGGGGNVSTDLRTPAPTPTPLAAAAVYAPSNAAVPAEHPPPHPDAAAVS